MQDTWVGKADLSLYCQDTLTLSRPLNLEPRTQNDLLQDRGYYKL